ncbi:MAG: tetratricopeptide repeat protein [Clostridiales bacterium]
MRPIETILVIIILALCTTVSAQQNKGSYSSGSEAIRDSATIIDIPSTLLEISGKVNLIENNGSRVSKGKLVEILDRFCSNKKIEDIPSNGFDLLLEASEKIILPDDQLAAYSSIENDYSLEISFNEFGFRALNAIQRHLQELFDRLHSREKLYNIPPFTTINLQISQNKARLLSRQIWIITLCEKKEEKLRAWLSIKRMLNEIDIPNSEKGGPIVQRSPMGIITSSGEIIGKLNRLSENENEEDIKSYSQVVIRSLLDAPSKYKEQNTTIGLNELGGSNFNEGKINKVALVYFQKASAIRSVKEKIYFYTEAIKSDSNFAAAYNNRANCYLEQKILDSAENDFRQVLVLDDGYYTAYKYLGQIQLKRGKYKSALKSFTQALNYEISDTLLINRGMCYKNLGETEKAISDFTRAIQYNSKSLVAYINRVQCYISSKQYDNAQKDYKRLIILEPQNSNHYYNLGCIYSIKKDWDKVIEVWEKGLKINPQDKNILTNLPKARASMQRGKSKE